MWRVAPVPLLFLLASCAPRGGEVIEAFPSGDLAYPWILQGSIWNGTFAQAAEALASDTQLLAEHEPQHVWIARYRHVRQRDRQLTVRCFAFRTDSAATAAYNTLAPDEAKDFEAGDEGCWTSVGILFRWGRLVCEVFGPEASWDSEVQSAMLAGFLTKRMPAAAPADPR